MTVDSPYTLIGAEVSLYSGKARAYLRHKRIPFREVLATKEVIDTVVKPRTGLRMVPVVISDDDIAVQDTTAIIDFCEARFPARSVYPEAPCQRLAALLLEVYGDEWLLLPAMHYRWHYKRENFLFIARAFGELLAPDAPRFLQPAAGLPLAAYFGGAYGPALGVTPHNRGAIEARYLEFLDAFERHLEVHPYLLGERPSLGDFGFMAPLYAHLYRDPHPGRLMLRRAPRVAAWVERMNGTAETAAGEAQRDWAANGAVPATLDPIFRNLFEEMWPAMEATAREVDRWADGRALGTRAPRFVGRHPFWIRGRRATRAAQTFTQWMVQRPLAYYRSLEGAARDDVDAWLARVGGEKAMQLEVRSWLERREDNRLYTVASP